MARAIEKRLEARGSGAGQIFWPRQKVPTSGQDRSKRRGLGHGSPRVKMNAARSHLLPHGHMQSAPGMTSTLGQRGLRAAGLTRGARRWPKGGPLTPGAGAGRSHECERPRLPGHARPRARSAHPRGAARIDAEASVKRELQPHVLPKPLWCERSFDLSRTTPFFG